MTVDFSSGAPQGFLPALVDLEIVVDQLDTEQLEPVGLP